MNIAIRDAITRNAIGTAGLNELVNTPLDDDVIAWENTSQEHKRDIENRQLFVGYVFDLE